MQLILKKQAIVIVKINTILGKLQLKYKKPTKFIFTYNKKNIYKI